MRAGNHGAPEAANLEGIHESSATTTDINNFTGLDGEFWQCRPSLRRVRDMSYHRLVAPWAVLGGCIVRTLSIIPPWITLPPTTGGRASLNAFVAIVADSGGGKGASEAVAAELIPFDEAYNIAELPAGSGEGLAHAYVHRATTGEDKGQIVRDRTSCLFKVPEVDTLTSVAGRQGSTIMSKLRSAYSGEEIGFSYADPAKRLLVGAHRYRLTLSLGVQPERAVALLGDAAGGTPQRFIWLPARDPSMILGRGKEVSPIDVVELRAWAGSERHIDVPEVARKTVERAVVDRHRGAIDALDGHGLQTRLKVMVALAAMDGRTTPNDTDWHLAGHVMRKSDATRAEVVAAIEAAEEADAEKRGKLMGVMRDAAGVSEGDKKVRRFQARIARKLSRSGVCTQSELLKTFNWSERKDASPLEDALKRLAESGCIAVEKDPATAGEQKIELTPAGRLWLAENGGK